MAVRILMRMVRDVSIQTDNIARTGGPKTSKLPVLCPCSGYQRKESFTSIGL